MLELVPSEIAQLRVPLPEGIEEEFDRLDWISRSVGGEETQSLVEETDALVVKKTPGLTKDLMLEIQQALGVLRNLRLERN